jgi:hypothetical protein
VFVQRCCGWYPSAPGSEAIAVGTTTFASFLDDQGRSSSQQSEFHTVG